jgi:hypothetical protein
MNGGDIEPSVGIGRIAKIIGCRPGARGQENLVPPRSVGVGGDAGTDALLRNNLNQMRSRAGHNLRYNLLTRRALIPRGAVAYLVRAGGEGRCGGRRTRGRGRGRGRTRTSPTLHVAASCCGRSRDPMRWSRRDVQRLQEPRTWGQRAAPEGPVQPEQHQHRGHEHQRPPVTRDPPGESPAPDAPPFDWSRCLRTGRRSMLGGRLAPRGRPHELVVQNQVGEDILLHRALGARRIPA